MTTIHLNKRVPLPTEAAPDSGITDEELMAMIQARRQIGLDLMQQRYGKLIKSVSMKALHNESDADDVVQDVLVELWERASNYNPLKGKPLSWILAIARNRAIDRLRRRDTRWRGDERYANEEQNQRYGWSHVQEDILHGERSMELGRALASLPVAQQDAVKLAYFEQMSQREIAVFTGIPLGTIKTRLELGLKKMAISLRGFTDLLCAERKIAKGR